MLFCVTIAFAIYGVLGGFLEAFQLKGQVDAADRMVVTNRVNFMQPLPLSYVDRVARVQGVEAVTYVRWTLAYHREPKDIIPVVMIPADSYFRVFDKLKIPAADRQNFTQTRNGVVVGRARARLLGWKIGDRVTLNTMNEMNKDGGKQWEFVVSGIYVGENEADEQGIAGHYSYFNEGLAFGRDGINWMTVRTRDPRQNDAVARAIDQTFENSAAATKTQSEAAFGQAMLDQLGNIALIVMLVVGAAFVVILFIVGNTMLAAIREKYRDIGMLKVMGFPTRHIMLVVASEPVAIAMIGSMLGIGIAIVILGAIAKPLESVVPGLHFTAALFAGGFLLATALALMTGIAPTLIAFRLKIADALNRR